MNMEKLECFVVREAIPHTTTFVAENPEDIANFCDTTLHMTSMPKEQVVCFHVNVKSRVVSYEVISLGGLSSSVADPRDVFRSAIRKNSAAVILCHNHPSGDITQSAADTELTEKLINAGNILGIPLLDHVIVGTQIGSYYSFRQDSAIQF